MYRHIVLFWLKDPNEKNLQAARDKLRQLAGKIEGLISVEVELDYLHSERSCDLCLNMVFASKEALEAYRTHPAHLPVQAHMHAVRSASSAADYPIQRPSRRMPRLYGSLGPSCQDEETLSALFDEGMAGVRLNLLHKSLDDTMPYLDALYNAAAHRGIIPELLLDPGTKHALPAALSMDGINGIFCEMPKEEKDMARLRRSLAPGARLLARVESDADLARLPSILRYADEVVVARAALSRNLGYEAVAPAQKHIAQMANGAGLPFMVASELLYSMRERPVPTHAEALDIYNAVQDGASSLLLTYETTIGKYPIEAMSALRRVAEAGAA